MDAVADADVNSKNNYVSADDGVVRLLVVLLWVFVVQGTTALDYICKALQAHTDCPTTYEVIKVNSMDEIPCEILHNRAQMVTINDQLRGGVNHQY